MKELIKKLILSIVIFTAFACTAPGVQPPKSNYSFSGDTNYYSELDELLEVININDQNINDYYQNSQNFFIDVGDALNITIWGLPEAFPLNAVNAADNPLNTRTVANDGTIFFPYVGIINVVGLSVNDARELITNKLKENFINPQVDVTVVGFNKNRNVYVVGEIRKPTQIIVGLEPVSLMDAIGQSQGINPATSNPREVYVFRSINDKHEIYKFNLTTGDKFLTAHKFNLQSKDVVYIGPSNITNWNRVISQLFPFSSFLNQLDLISSRND